MVALRFKSATGILFDDFEEFLLVDEGMAPITAERMRRRLERATRTGLRLDEYTSGAEGARLAGRSYLRRRRAETTTHAYNNDVKVLHALLRWKGVDGVKFAYVREPRKQFRALTPSEVRDVLAYEAIDPLASRMHRALSLIALKTGARASEVAAMNLSDLDAPRKRIRIRVPAKGGLQRWLPVEGWVFSPKRPLAAWLAVRPVPKKDSDALWTTNHKSGNGSYKPGDAPARRVSPDYLRMCLYRVGQDVGVHLNFNVCRHTRATELLKRGWNLLYVKEYLGHASVKSTEVYAEVRPEDVEEQMRKSPGHDWYQEET